MGAPSGLSGVQRMAKAGHSGGLRRPCSTWALMHSAGSSATMWLRRKARSASSAAYSCRKRNPLRGNGADAPPLLVGHLEHLAHNPLGAKVAGLVHRAGVLVFHPRRPRLELQDQHENALQQIHWLKARNHDGHAEVPDQFLVVVGTHHRAHVSGSDEALNAVGR
jgi:hypothetical protein